MRLVVGLADALLGHVVPLPLFPDWMQPSWLSCRSAG